MDLSRLLELDPAGQNGLVARVLLTYQQSTLDLLERMRAAALAQDHRAFFLAVHTLKSSSDYVGANSLAKACAELERRLREQTGAPLSMELSSLQAVAVVVQSALEQHLLAWHNPGSRAGSSVASA